MPDIESVKANRKQVATQYNTLLRGMSGLQISELGLKFKNEDLVIDPTTGVWADRGRYSKNTAWLVNFQYDESKRKWVAGLEPPHHDHQNRLTGSFNSGSPLQGMLVRIFPVLRTTELNQEAEDPDDQWVTHPYWEWSLVYVFPGEAVFSKNNATAQTGSSGASIDLNLETGELLPNVGGKQPYVAAALFTLVPPNDSFTAGRLTVTYGELTDALKEYIRSAPIKPESVPESQVA